MLWKIKICLRWFSHSTEEIKPHFKLFFCWYYYFSNLKERGKDILGRVEFNVCLEEEGDSFCTGDCCYNLYRWTDLFHNWRSSINKFRSIITESKNKKIIALFQPLFKLQHREQITLFFFLINTCEIHSVVRWKPALQLGTIKQHLSTFFCIYETTLFTYGLYY